MNATFATDAAIAVVWMAVNGLIAVGSWCVARRTNPRADRVDLLMDALVIGMTAIVCSTILVGIAGVLSGGVLLAAVAVTALVGVVLTRQATPDPSALVVDALANSEAMCPDSTAPTNSRREMMERIGWMLIWTFLAGYLLLHIASEGLLTFTTDWDSLMYHIPMIDEWLQAKAIYAPDSAYWWSPGNSEILGLWCVAPFSGDFLVALNNLLTMILWVVATLSMCRSLGMSRTFSHLTALGVVAVVTSFHETRDASNDIALAAFFTAAVSYALRHFRTNRLHELILGGLSLGLLAGVKYFSIGYVSLVLGVWVAGTLFQRGPMPAVRAALVLGLSALPAGAYWYVRNAVLTGTPVYPMGLAGSLPEVGYPNLSETSFWGNPDPARWSFVVPILAKMAGPCHVAAVLCAPVVVIGLLVMGIREIRKDGSLRHARNTLAMVLLLSGCGVLILISPWSVEDQPRTLNQLRTAWTPMRYGLSFLSMCVIGFAWFLERCARALDGGMARSTSDPGSVLSGRFENATATLLGVTVVGQWACRFFYWRFYASPRLDFWVWCASLIFAIVLVSWGLWLSGPRRPVSLRVALSACCTLSLGVVGIGMLSQRWHAGYDEHFNRHFGGPMFSEMSEHPEDYKRICVLDQRVYPYYGAARQRHVCRPRYLESFDALINYLRDREVSVVVTHLRANSSARRDSFFDLYHDPPGWLESAPDAFVPVMQGWYQAIYRRRIGGAKDSTPD